jgi:preprotein translocase subunit SecE
MDSIDRKQLRIVLIVVAGFVCGLGLLFFLIATDV